MNSTKKPKKTKEDTISQLKKEEKKAQKDSKKEEEEEYHQDSEEEETNTKETEVKEQTVQKADKPKSLKELLNTVDDNKPKDKKKQEKKQEKKSKKFAEEPGKLKFTNSKRKGNADEIDKEIRARREPEKKTYTNAQGLNAAAKENEKIKPTKNYLEKDTKKQYKDEKEEEIEKPKFKTNIKEGDENFVALNKNEDVSKYIYLI